MENNTLLTKSDFLLFLEAPLHLWAERHDHIDRTPSAFETHLSYQGYQVEHLAQEYLEKFILESGQRLISQETFTDNRFTARVDFLVHQPGSDSYHLYEVKSSTGVKPENQYDATFQFLIASQYLKIDRVFILHLNKEYTRSSNLDIEQLFITTDITEKVCQLIDTVKTTRQEALETACLEVPKGIPHCLDPKTCPYPKLCHPGLPETSIYDVPKLSKKKKMELINQGIRDIKDIPGTFPLSAKQRQIVNVAQSNQELIKREEIQKEFERFVFPLYFLDYETCLAAVPICEGYKPHQHMVFQYSLHKMESLNDEIRHTEHLAITKTNPSKSLVKQLREDIGDIGTVFVWFKPFEMTRNKELAALHPEYADFLTDLNERIYDLGDFINFGYYLHPGFKGGWSIKNVLPVMVPELSYDQMEIGKGDQAMAVWWELINNNPSSEEMEKTKTALLEYCKLDTWAMVRIFQCLHQQLQTI